MNPSKMMPAIGAVWKNQKAAKSDYLVSEEVYLLQEVNLSWEMNGELNSPLKAMGKEAAGLNRVEWKLI